MNAASNSPVAPTHRPLPALAEREATAIFRIPDDFATPLFRACERAAWPP